MKEETVERIRKFTRDRAWEPYHTPANLAKSIVIEAAELLENFQWSAEAESSHNIDEELADVLVYCLQLAEVMGYDPDEIIMRKMDQNEAKYPVEKARGSSKKYTEL